MSPLSATSALQVDGRDSNMADRSSIFQTSARWALWIDPRLAEIQLQAMFWK